MLLYFITPGRRQSKTLSTIDERGSKIDRNSVFDCHLSPVWRQMVIENTVSIDFYLRSKIVLAFSIVAYPVCLYVFLLLCVCPLSMFFCLFLTVTWVGL